MVNPAIFEEFLKGVDSGLSGATPPAPSADRGARIAGGFGQGLGGLSKLGMNPGVAALAGVGSLMQGDLVGAVGEGGGAALAAKFGAPLVATAARINPLLGAATAIGLPIVGSALGGATAKGAANMIEPAAAAIQNAAGSAVNNAINPSAPTNVAQGAQDDIFANYNKMRAALGEDLANSYLQQALHMDKVDQIDQNRNNRAIRVAPVRSAARLAELGAEGGIAMALRGMDGTNQMLSNVTARNPYAEMLS